MKKTNLIATFLIAGCLSFITLVQENPLLQKVDLLSPTELKIVEDNLSTALRREAATWIPGGFSAVIFSGKTAITKQNIASYLAQKIRADLYRVDLSRVVSENILVTQRNLDLIFEYAADKNGLLFFDEAEALFGRRTSGSNSHDRYDSTGTNYFMRQVEKYRSHIIISVKTYSNINPVIFENYVRFAIH